MSGRPSQRQKREEGGPDDTTSGIQTRRMANRGRSIAGDSHDENAGSSQDEADNADQHQDDGDTQQMDNELLSGEEAVNASGDEGDSDTAADDTLPYTQYRAEIQAELSGQASTSAVSTTRANAPPPAAAAKPTPKPRKALAKTNKSQRPADNPAPQPALNNDPGSQDSSDDEFNEANQPNAPLTQEPAAAARRPSSLQIPRPARAKVAPRAANVDTETEYDTADESVRTREVRRQAEARRQRYVGTKRQHRPIDPNAGQPEAMGDARAPKPPVYKRQQPNYTDAETDYEYKERQPATHVDVIQSLVGLIADKRRVLSEVGYSKFDGTKWEAFKSQFTQACKINKWDDEEKATRLRCALTGPALAFLYNAGCEEWDYDKLMTQMDKRFGSVAADLNLIEAAAKFTMQPKEPVLHFADRINESFAKSSMDTASRNAFCWFTFMQGMGKHHAAMRSSVQSKVKKQDYQKALEYAEIYEKNHATIDDTENAIVPYNANSALIAQLEEKLKDKQNPNKTKRKAPAGLADIVAKATEAKIAAMIKQLDNADSSDSDTSDSSADDEKMEKFTERMDSTIARVQQLLVDNRINNNVKLKQTKPIPSTGNTDKRLEALTDKLLALEQAVEERERNRQAANAKRMERNKKKGFNGKPRYNNGYKGKNQRNYDDYDDRRDNRRNDSYDDRRYGRSQDSRDRREDSYQRRPSPAPPAVAPQRAAVASNHA